MSDLPPLEEPQAYVVVGPDDQRGPYTMELLIGEVLAGRLSDATPVWWPGLADWTTMGGHPALAAEVQRRRAATTAAPAWADPGTQPSAPAPSYEQQSSYGQSYGEQQSSYGQPSAESVAQEPSTGSGPFSPGGHARSEASPSEAAQTQYFGQPTAPDAAPASGSFDVGASDAGSFDANVIDAEATEVVPGGSGPTAAVIDPAQQDRFDDLVARSRERSAGVERVAALDARMRDAARDAASDAGFSATGADAADSDELHFEGIDGLHLVVALGRLDDDAVRAPEGATVPLDVSVRSSAQATAVGSATGHHGEIVVVADEWSGQSTSSVGLLLGLSDYLDAEGGLDDAALRSDISAAIAVVRSRLG